MLRCCSEWPCRGLKDAILRKNVAKKRLVAANWTFLYFLGKMALEIHDDLKEPGWPKFAKDSKLYSPDLAPVGTRNHDC